MFPILNLLTPQTETPTEMNTPMKERIKQALETVVQSLPQAQQIPIVAFYPQFLPLLNKISDEELEKNIMKVEESIRYIKGDINDI